MDERQKIYVACGMGGAGLLFLLATTWASCRTKADKDQFTLPRDTYWVCQNDACNHTFSLRRTDLIKYQKAHPESRTPPCPKCGKNTAVAATKCPHCGTIYPTRGSSGTARWSSTVPASGPAPGGGLPVCPNCGKPAVGPA